MSPWACPSSGVESTTQMSAPELHKHQEHSASTHLGGHHQMCQENCEEDVPLILLTAIKKHHAPEHVQHYDNQRHESWKTSQQLVAGPEDNRHQSHGPHDCSPARRVPWLQSQNLTTSAQNWLWDELWVNCQRSISFWKWGPAFVAAIPLEYGPGWQKPNLDLVFKEVPWGMQWD